MNKAPRKRRSLAQPGQASALDAWLAGIGLGGYAALLRRHSVELEVLPELTEADLEKIGMPLGHRKKLLKAVIESPWPTGGAASIAPSPNIGTERRQLTVMFCDLVGYTALSASIDPEDLRQVILAYQDCCKGVIERFGGHVAQYLGDGVLAYFGYPQALEDSPEGAVRAGLGVVAATQELQQRVGLPLQTRAGIETGQVVIGDLSGSAWAAGSTPNMAARLQTLADPGTAVVGPTTRALTQGLFEYADLGYHSLKGFPDPVQAWRVLGPSSAASRFEALRGASAPSPLVGRRYELARLRRCWREAASGRGRVVVISGEPGIGKSRLVEALKEAVAHGGRTPAVRMRARAKLVEYSCAPYFQTSPFHPVIEHLQRSLRIGAKDTPAQKLRQLEEAFGGSEPGPSEMVPLFASLLSVPLEERHPGAHLSPQKRREKTLEALAAWLLGDAERQPVLLVVEDLQWADPSTLALVALLVERAPRVPVLVVLTTRTDFDPPWDRSNRYTRIRLNGLAPQEVSAMVERLSRGKPLPAEVLDQLSSKTDGVPLFVEELLKAVLESRVVQERGSRYVLAGQFSSLAIPASLQDTLMARLDRLAAGKPVAQLAATIGRQFPHRLLQALWYGDRASLQAGLAQLLDAELVYQTAAAPDASYEFKHALVQDTAYQSLLKSTRREYHRRIAEVLEQRFPESLETQPGLVAHHFTAADLPEQAIPYWLRAAETALQRSASLEAIAHLETGLAASGKLPEGVPRTRHELDLLLALASALTLHQGIGDSEVEGTYRRARSLWGRLGQGGKATLAHWGLWVHYGLWAHYHVRGSHRTAQSLAKQILAMGQRHSDRLMNLVGHTAVGCSRLYQGDFAAALQHLEQAQELYRFGEDRSMFLRTAHELGVVSLTYGAQALWILGFPDRALMRARQAIDLAQQSPPHPYGLFLALAYLADIHLMRGEAEEARRWAEQGIAVSREQGLPFLLHSSMTARGFARTAEPGAADGIEELRQGLEGHRASGFQLIVPRGLNWLAEAYGRCGEIPLGLGAVTEAIALASKAGGRLWEAESYRIEGELLLRCPGREAQGEACLQRALALAQKQGARSMELRAALGLARWWRAHGKTSEAGALLSPIYKWFAEGFETKDLRNARHLLEELGPDIGRRGRAA